jgi:hypothetical protein
MDVDDATSQLEALPSDFGEPAGRPVLTFSLVPPFSGLYWRDGNGAGSTAIVFMRAT